MGFFFFAEALWIGKYYIDNYQSVLYMQHIKFIDSNMLSRRDIKGSIFF